MQQLLDEEEGIASDAMPGPPKISVIIPTFNRREVLARTLPAVLAQDLPPEDYEVVVVVDGSTDGTAEFLRRQAPPCPFRVLEQPNRGQAVAMNAGLRAAGGELVLFLDDDILCERTLLTQHLAAHRDAEPLVAFGPVLIAPDSPPTLATAWARRYFERLYALFEALPEPREARWPHLPGIDPNCSAPRSALLDAGGFDESFFRWGQSGDLALRLWKSGLRFRYLPSAIVQQVYVKSAQDLVRGDARAHGRAEVQLCRKHPEYRSHSLLARLHEGPAWKGLARRLAARSPLSPEPLLRLPFRAAETLRSQPWVCRLGIALLGARMGIESYRSAVRETGSWEALRSEFGVRLPVLIYHHIGEARPGPDRWLTITPEQLEHHLRWLLRRGYTGIRPSDWLAWCREGKPLPPKPVLIAFDDAYADVAQHALPLVQRCGFGAVVFVVTGFVGATKQWGQARRGGALMTAKQIRHWDTQGIEFGAHSRSHPDLRTLTGAELDSEVAGSGEDLAQILGRRPLSFAYPYGHYNQAVLDSAAGAFELAFSTEEGLNDLGTDPRRLRRTMVWPDDSTIDLACRLRLGWSPPQQLQHRLARVWQTTGQ